MMNYIKSIRVVLILLLIVISCGGNDDASVNSVERDAVLRTLEIQSADFNLCDTSSFFSLTAEVEDYANGDLLDNVTVLISFIDNTDDGIDYSTAEEQFTVIAASAFTPGPSGLPVTTFTVTLQEISSALNVVSYNGGDTFRIRFEINLTDGRSFASDNGSPFAHDAVVTVPLIDEPDFFSGQYLMEQLSGSDPFFSAETFGDTQIVNITADGNVRSFDFFYFPGIFDSDYNFSMNLVCGEIRVTGTINAGGLGCGGSNVGFTTGEPASTYDETFTDDDVVIVNVTDFSPDGNCDTGGYQVVLRFTKQ